MVEILNRERKLVSVLENASNVSRSTPLNSLATATFELPYNDPKLKECGMRRYVRITRGTEKSTLYRILKRTKIHQATGMVAFTCEHVVATLIDEQIDGYVQIGNKGTYTRQVLEYILDQQKVKNWVLGRCDFNREFEYGFDNETLYASIKSVAEPITANYKWDYDTTSYPWVINLVEIDTSANPQSYFRYGKNIQSITVSEDSTNLATRLKCLGWGEGVNQLDITSVNNGSMFLLADQASIDTYGEITYTWVDRRFTHAETLKARGEVMLEGLKAPRREYSLNVVNLFSITTDPLDEPRAGDITRCIDLEIGEDIRTVITKVDEKDIFGSRPETTICIANTPEDIAGTIAKQADRLRNEQLYSQGSKSIYVMNFADNADPTHPAEIDLFIPSDVVNMNYVNILIRLAAFRAYSLTAAAGGGAVQATSNQDAQSSSSGGGTFDSTSSGGGGTSGGGGGVSKSTSSANILSNTSLPTVSNSGAFGGILSSSLRTEEYGLNFDQTGIKYHSHATTSLIDALSGFINGHTHTIDHSHNIVTAAHIHDFNAPDHSHTISAHTHSLNIAAHTHTIPGHGHTVPLPSHTHAAVYGIFEGARATTATVTIDGRIVAIPIGQDYDIVPLLSVDPNTGKIRRGASQSIKVTPNSLTRIAATVTVGLFSGSTVGTAA